MIFNSNERSTTSHINNPFRPDGLNNRVLSNHGGPSKLSAKPRKRNQLQQLNTISPSNSTPSPLNTIRPPSNMIRSQSNTIRSPSND